MTIHDEICDLHRDCMARINRMWWICEYLRLGLDTEHITNDNHSVAAFGHATDHNGSETADTGTSGATPAVR